MKVGRRTISRNTSKQGKPIRYVISILHKKPELGEGVRFRSTYYADESKDASVIRDVFKEAFHVAHPSWIIEEVTVKEGETKRDLHQRQSVQK